MKTYFEQMTKEIKEAAQVRDCSTIGIGKIRGAQSVIIVGQKLPIGLEESGRLKMIGRYLKLFRQDNYILNGIIEILKQNNHPVEKKTFLSVFGDIRPLAVAAGLGDVGKNGLVLNPKYGSNLLYSAVFTSADLLPDQRIENVCIKCERCYQACPSFALSDKGLNYKRCLPFSLRGCQDCVDACPIGEREIKI